MAGLTGVHEEGGCAGARERGRNFIADVARFTHAGDDDAALAVQDQVAGPAEVVVKPRSKGRNGVGLGAENGEPQLDVGVFCHGYASTPS